MGVANPPADPANIVQALVYTLSDVFDATRDLYRNLTIKEQREYEQNLRAKGYPATRRVEYVKDERLGSDEAITTDKSTVVRQFEIGYQVLGAEFAMGDVIAHTELQSQIITLQSVLVTTCLYGPSSTDPIAHQLSNINAASRAAAATSIEILAALQERQMNERPLTPKSIHSATARSSPHHASSGVPSHVASHVISHHSSSHAPSHVPSQHTFSHAPSLAPSQSASRARSVTISHAPSHAPSHMPSHTGSRTPTRATSRASSQVPSRSLALPPPPTGMSSASTALMKYEDPQPRSSHVRSSSPVNTTVLDWRSKVEPESVVSGTTAMTGPSSSAVTSASGNLYCRYAYDLQRDPTKQLHGTVVSSKEPYCPHCKGELHLSPGKAWEISKWAGDTERTFQVQNRFVVKCHRDGPDGQYCCVICSKYADSDTICGDVKALVKHLSDEHEVRELKHEEDIVEVIEQPGSRRDSGTGYGSSRGSRRSASLASGRGRRRKSLSGYDREVDVFDMRSSRR